METLYLQSILKGMCEEDAKKFGTGTRSVRVFINGKPIGWTSDKIEFADCVRNMRRCLCISPHVSVYSHEENEIDIVNYSGRPLRPIWVKGRQVQGSDSDFYELLECGAIEFVDKREELSMDVRDIKQITKTCFFGGIVNRVIFANHNQSPRVIYQSSMVKQAISVPQTTFQKRYKNGAHHLVYTQRPIVDTQYSRMARVSELLPNGYSAIVAICNYGGANQEDSIIVNKASLDRGLFRTATYYTFRCEVQRKGSEKEELVHPKSVEGVTGLSTANYGKIDEEGLPEYGAFIEKNDVVIGKIVRLKNAYGSTVVRCRSIIVKKNVCGYIDNIVKTTTKDGKLQVIVRMIRMRRPETGDKLASRSAQKVQQCLFWFWPWPGPWFSPWFWFWFCVLCSLVLSIFVGRHWSHCGGGGHVLLPGNRPPTRRRHFAAEHTQ